MSEDHFDADAIYADIERQVALGPRRAGSPAGLASEEQLEARLRELGLEEVRREAIPITTWTATEEALEVGGEHALEAVDAFPIPFCAFTPEEGVQGRLVWADRKALRHTEDWTGAIVVAEIGFPPLDLSLLLKVAMGVVDPDGTVPLVDHPATWVRLGWHLYHLAARRGAAGFVGILADQPGGTARMYAPYGFKEADIHDKPLPGFWVGRAAGPRLQQLARCGRGQARLRVLGVREPGITHNVVGEIPGSTEECMVLSCHHDSPFASPVEDASGVAVVLAVAGALAARRTNQRRVIVLLSAGHFYGSMGTRTFIHEHPEVVKSAAVELTLEHMALEAVEGPDGDLVPTGRPEAAGVFVPLNQEVSEVVVDCLSRAGVRRAVLLPAEGPLGPYPPTDGGDWYEAGVPVINHITNPVYLLTEDDGMEWVDREALPRVAAAYTEVIRRLDGMDRQVIAHASAPRLALMRVLQRVVSAKTTFFGTRPVY